MLFRLCILLCGFFCVNLMAAECLQASRLKALDARYEEALRVGDVKLLDKLLADDFVWVHNLEADIENKSALLQRLQNPGDVAKTRKSHDITAHRLDDTVVLSGLSSVEKYNPDGKTIRTSRYRFMRTYVATQKIVSKNVAVKAAEKNVPVKQECQLLSVQTMKVWSSETPGKFD